VPGPVAAGTVPDAGILFFLDYDGRALGRPDHGRTFDPALYRYDGTTGSITKVSDWYPFSAGGLAHETANGIYLRGPQGRWDLLRWDGTRASDQEFTACQPFSGNFASWCAVSATGVGVGWGTHVGSPCKAPAPFIRFPGDTQGRQLLRAELCVQWIFISADGTQLLIRHLAAEGAATRGTCASDAIEIDGTCYRQRLLVMPVGGEPRPLNLSPDLPGVAMFTLAADGRWAMAENMGGLSRVDLATGRTTDLGPIHALAFEQARWSANGRIAFVRGGAQESWIDKTVVVVAPDGSTTEVRGDRRVGGHYPSGLAPAWDPTGMRLAWIAARGSSGEAAAVVSQDLLDGRGVGDRRVLVSDLGSEPLEIRCGEGVAEGVRWSQDGSALLLLCRRPGTRVNGYELWLYRLGASGGAVPIVRGLTLGTVDTYGNAPSLFANTAWSRALATPPR
jgi:hypothetical protein